MSVLSLGIIGVVVVLAASIVWGTIRSGISPMPSSRQAMDAVMGLIPDNFSGQVYELGSGWGQLAIRIAKKHPHARVTGLELSPLPHFFSKVWSHRNGLGNLEFVSADFTRLDLSDGDLVVCYLYPKAMTGLAQQLGTQLSAHAIIISNTFRLPNWTPSHQVELDDLYRTRIYRYGVETSRPAPPSVTLAETMATSVGSPP